MTMTAKDRERFLAKVAVGGPTECWPWQLSVDRKGYGFFKVSGKNRLAHRIAWTIAHGDPGALCVLHRCDNPPCCNPAHLFLGTIADNNADMAAKKRGTGGRSGFSSPGASNPSARLSEEQVREIRKAVERGERRMSVAVRFDVHLHTVHRIASRKSWACLKDE